MPLCDYILYHYAVFYFYYSFTDGMITLLLEYTHANSAEEDDLEN